MDQMSAENLKDREISTWSVFSLQSKDLLDDKFEKR